MSESEGAGPRGGSPWLRLAEVLGDLREELVRPGERAGAGAGSGAGSGAGAGGGSVVGSLADDLARLLESWQHNLRGHTGPECQVCPVCQAIAVVRHTRPEALDHLVAAVGEVAAAVRLVVTPQDERGDGATAADGGPAPGASGEAGSGAGRQAGRREPVVVEHIDVTD